MRDACQLLPRGYRPGYAAVFGRPHNVRGPVDGRAGRDVAGEDVCGAALGESFDECGVSGVEELAEIRATMREQVRRSPLCDAPRFARDFLELTRQAWEQRVKA
jgi:hypothetical protein